jgi:hypothetical protein
MLKIVLLLDLVFLRAVDHCGRDRVYKSPSCWGTRNRSICKHDPACNHGGARPVLKNRFVPTLPVARYLDSDTGWSLWIDRFLVPQYEGDT